PAVNQWLFSEETGVIDKELGRKVIHTVHDDIVSADDLESIVGAKSCVVDLDRHMGIERENLGLCRVDLGPPNVIGLVNDLSLKIGEVHDIGLVQPDCPDASRRQIKSDRGA